MYFQNALHRIVDEHLLAWNNRDIDCILNSLADNAELESQALTRIFGNGSGQKIIGKQNLEEFYKLIFKSPQFNTMSMKGIVDDGKTMFISLSIDNSNVEIKSRLVVDQYGKLNYLGFLRD